MKYTLIFLTFFVLSSCSYRIDQSSDGLYREMARGELSDLLKLKPGSEEFLGKLGFPTQSVKVWTLDGLLEERWYYSRITFERIDSEHVYTSLRPEPFTVFFDDQSRFLRFEWGDYLMHQPMCEVP